MKFTKNNAHGQMCELNHIAIENSDASESFKSLCHYFVSAYKEGEDTNIDSYMIAKYENLRERYGIELSFEDMIDELHEWCYSIGDLLVLSVIEPMSNSDDIGSWYNQGLMLIWAYIFKLVP